MWAEKSKRKKNADKRMNKISVIIPAYNALKTVERTVSSVLASTIPLDVWVVDDGSKDGTGELLDNMNKARELANGSRLNIIHQPNCGAYQARLNALKRITTPYFGFVDADDTVDPTMFEMMLAAIEQEQLDAVQCRLVGDDCDGSLTVLSGKGLDKYKFGYLVNPKVSCYIWDKLYKNQYDFEAFELTDKVTNFDDMIFNLQFFRKVNRFGLLDEGLYKYSQTEGSAVHTYGPRQKHDFKWMVNNHYRLTRALFSDGEYGRILLWLGHLHWYAINLRNAIICRAR